MNLEALRHRRSMSYERRRPRLHAPMGEGPLPVGNVGHVRFPVVVVVIDHHDSGPAAGDSDSLQDPRGVRLDHLTGGVAAQLVDARTPHGGGPAFADLARGEGDEAHRPDRRRAPGRLRCAREVKAVPAEGRPAARIASSVSTTPPEPRSNAWLPAVASRLTCTPFNVSNTPASPACKVRRSRVGAPARDPWITVSRLVKQTSARAKRAAIAARPGQWAGESSCSISDCPSSVRRRSLRPLARAATDAVKAEANPAARSRLRSMEPFHPPKP